MLNVADGFAARHHHNSIKYIPFGCWLKGTTMAFIFLDNFLENMQRNKTIKFTVWHLS